MSPLGTLNIVSWAKAVADKTNPMTSNQIVRLRLMKTPNPVPGTIRPGDIGVCSAVKGS
jgi:hypothetical protein